MLRKILLGLLVILIAFLGYVASREGKFRYERTGVINASPDKIYPYLSNFKLGSEWNPWDRMDPTMKKTYSGTDGTVGAKMDFEGNSQVGSGELEVLNLVPNQSVQLKLTMRKPFRAENTIDYTLTSEGSGTRFSWAMSGDGGFMGKLMGVFIDCEKMVGGELEKGIANLKQLVETKK